MTDSPFLSGLGDVLISGAKGAAAGAALGPIGAGVGGLAGLASSLVPHIFGTDATPILAAAAKAITGSDDEATRVEILSTDSAALAAYKVQALKIAADREQSQLDAQSNDIAARLGDVADARQQTLNLSKQGSAMAWGAAIVSALLLAMWFGSMIANYYGAPALSSDDSATLRNLALLVAGYWIGTNRSSDRKTDILANSLPGWAIPKPAAIVPAGDVSK